MCGIAGILDSTQTPSREHLVAMVSRLAHRGPDDSGIYMSKGVAMGHTRLSIIDLSPLGHQPMQTPDRNLTIVYNGELYNYRELRRELEALGIPFLGHSDTEVVLWGCRVWGMDALRRFNGMFAFALWDSAREELLLARDRFGIKPLYLWQRDGKLAFGSEIKALLALPQVKRSLDPEALHEYLYFGNALGSRTLFTEIRKIAPGHAMIWKDGQCRTECFWSPLDVRPVTDSFDEAKERVCSLLDAAVQRHLVSDVPVGLFLSGGIDSSAIATFAARRLGKHLHTYSVGFDFDDSQTELPRANKLARMLGTNHHELRITGVNLEGAFESLIGAHDQPFGDAANIPLYLLCEALQGEVKVVLQGDGGDEMFAGYRRYNLLASRTMWKMIRGISGRWIDTMPRSVVLARARRIVDAAGHPDINTAMALLLTEETLVSPPLRILSKPIQASIGESDPLGRYRQIASKLPELDDVQRMLYVDSQIILPDIFLEKVDRPTMAKSVEVRVPFLDTELSSYAMGLPAHWKIRRLQKKYILREALRHHVPDDILDGKKRGFGVPFGSWLRGPLKKLLLEAVASDSAQPELFDKELVRRMVAEHLNGSRDWGLILYKLLGLSLWAHRYRVSVV